MLYSRWLFIPQQAVSITSSSFCDCVVCLPGTFGEECELTCDSCLNGADCNFNLNGCDCAPGWFGLVCDEPCPQVVLYFFTLCLCRLKSLEIQFIKQFFRNPSIVKAYTFLPYPLCLVMKSKHFQKIILG